MSIKAATGHEVKGYCLHKPGAWQDEPWEGDVVAKVGSKIFAFLGEDTVGVKCGKGRAEADEWIEEFPDEVTVSPYIGRHGFKLLDGGRTVDVGRYHQHLFLLTLLKELGQFTHGGGFTGPLQTCHEDHGRRRSIEIQGFVEIGRAHV